MEINIKIQQNTVTTITEKEFNLPNEACYFYESGAKRYIRIIPIWTKRNMEEMNIPEEIYMYHFTLIYCKFSNRIESFTIPISNFEELYNSDKYLEEAPLENSLIRGVLNNWYEIATKEDFTNYLAQAIANLDTFS